MATVGYGDIVPVTPEETVWAILQMVAGASIFAYIVGNMASLLGALDSRSAVYREKLEGITQYLQEHSVPLSIKQKVKQYVGWSGTSV